MWRQQAALEKKNTTGYCEREQYRRFKNHRAVWEEIGPSQILGFICHRNLYFMPPVELIIPAHFLVSYVCRGDFCKCIRINERAELGKSRLELWVSRVAVAESNDVLWFWQWRVTAPVFCSMQRSVLNLKTTGRACTDKKRSKLSTNHTVDRRSVKKYRNAIVILLEFYNNQQWLIMVIGHIILPFRMKYFRKQFHK